MIKSVSGVGLVYGELEFSKMKVKSFVEWMGENGYLQDYVLLQYPPETCEFNASFMDLAEEIGRHQMTAFQVLFDLESKMKASEKNGQIF